MAENDQSGRANSVKDVGASRRTLLFGALGAATAGALGGAAVLSGLFPTRGGASPLNADGFDAEVHKGLYRSATAPYFVEIGSKGANYFCETRAGLAFLESSNHRERRAELRSASVREDGALALDWWGILDPEVLEPASHWPSTQRFGGGAPWSKDAKLSAAAFLDLLARNQPDFAERGLSLEDETLALNSAAERGEDALFIAMGALLVRLDDGHGALYGRGRYAYGAADQDATSAAFGASPEGRGGDPEEKLRDSGAARFDRLRKRHGGAKAADGSFFWWRDDETDIAYFAPLWFEGLAERGSGGGADVAAAEVAYEKAFQTFQGARGLIIDLRYNGGGWDEAAVGLAARVAPEETLAFSKSVYRNGAFRPEFPVTVTPSKGARFVGPVAVLQSGLTFSAAEIALLSLRALSNVRSFGWRSGGALSDEMYFRLPNRWRGTFSNQVYRSADGQLFEHVGVPADEEAPALQPNAFWPSFDAPLTKALEWLEAQQT